MPNKTKQDELDDKEADLAAADADAEDSRAEKRDFEAALYKLRDARESLDNIHFDLGT